jgi:cytochrome bd-type quinol oxidase subunit 2
MNLHDYIVIAYFLVPLCEIGLGLLFSTKAEREKVKEQWSEIQKTISTFPPFVASLVLTFVFATLWIFWPASTAYHWIYDRNTEEKA